METEEITKLVDGIYKNILDKFNPGARQMINAGKAYLKALHGAAAASRLYVDAITKLARQSQQGTWGGSSDIGSALMQIVEVYKEIQAQQMNILKAFYVDLLVPLETNLEKDTKVVQSEQKRFLQQHKQRSETYSKAAATMKKQRKKQRNAAKTGIAMDKELKSMQILEEERNKLDAFCEQSLKNAMTQERRRYGFVLERQCSLAKHYLAYHSAGHSLYQGHLEQWNEIAKSREALPQSVENMFANKLSNVSFWTEDGSPKLDDDRLSLTSQLRKTKSVDASCLDVRAMGDLSSPPSLHPLARAKSDFNLTSSSNSLAHEMSTPERRPKSMAVPDTSTWDTPLARALYAYLSSGENQLSFLEGDVIALMGERNKGWQFGENLRTQCSGWFPLAYTEPFIDDTATSASSPTHRRPAAEETPGFPGAAGRPVRPSHHLTRFGDTLARNNSQVGGGMGRGIPPLGPPPTVPVPKPTARGGVGDGSGGVGAVSGVVGKPTVGGGGGGNTAQNPASLHSSNDSGFSNDPPPAPEVDYSDDENRTCLVEGKSSGTRSHLGSTGRIGGGALMSRRKEDTMRSWTEDDWFEKSASMVRQSSSAGHLSTLGRSHDQGVERARRQLNALALPYERKVKRTKSLWKFRNNKNDEGSFDVGTAMWRHRSLIDISQDDDNTSTVTKKQRPKKQPLPSKSRRSMAPASHVGTLQDTDSPDTDSCIVVNDHLKKAEESSTILPRTRLIRKRETTTTVELHQSRLGPPQTWYNSWDEINA